MFYHTSNWMANNYVRISASAMYNFLLQIFRIKNLQPCWVRWQKKIEKLNEWRYTILLFCFQGNCSGSFTNCSFEYSTVPSWVFCWFFVIRFLMTHAGYLLLLKLLFGIIRFSLIVSTVSNVPCLCTCAYLISLGRGWKMSDRKTKYNHSTSGSFYFSYPCLVPISCYSYRYQCKNNVHLTSITSK